jgi:hypothetical protein
LLSAVKLIVVSFKYYLIKIHFMHRSSLNNPINS